VQRVDPGVSGDVHGAAEPLPMQVRGGAGRGREQQVGDFIDGDAVALLRPRHGAVVAAQPGLDMADRQAGLMRRHRAAKRARRVPLYDDEVGLPPDENRCERGGDERGMLDRILDPGTAEFLARQATEAMVGRA
jgi:hypothetical protein